MPEIKVITEKIDKRELKKLVNKDLQKKIKEITFELIGKGEDL